MSTELKTTRIATYLPLIFIGVLHIWMTLEGLIGMFTLPFSKTQYFNFNPDPYLAVTLATLGYPLLINFICFTIKNLL